MEKSWSGESGTYGLLTDAQVRASALAFAQYNGWNSANGDVFYMDLIMKLRRSSGPVVPVSINISTLACPAARGAVNGATLAIHTNQPGANCSILVYDLPPLPGKPSTAGGLGPQIASGSGDASWTWTVEPTALVGLAQVQIQCSYHGLVGYAFTNIVIA